MPVIRLVGADHRSLGWILGYPISEEGKLLADRDLLRVPAQALASSEGLEAFIYSFGGRFAVVVLDVREPRFYLDACGSLSAVYCAHQRMVASTPNLIPYDERSRDRVELNKAIGIPRTDAMYPLGLTPRYGVERILPNHYLDLSDFRTVRHWPLRPMGEVASVEDAVAGIATLVKRNIAAVVAATPTYLLLTAGWDSRMLLACARGVADRLELFTAEIGDERAAIDCDTARRIARHLGMKHFVLPMEKARGEDLAEWMFRISYSTGERRGWECATMYKRLPGWHAMLLGNVGEVARGYWWRADDTETTVIGPERLIELCRCPPEAETLAQAGVWLEKVPAANALQVLDLFYVEQRLGCWAGVWGYAQVDPGFVIFSMCHRGIVERMLTLPAAYRRSGCLPQDIIAREWPELRDWPINQPIGSIRLLLPVKRAIRKGAMALRHPKLFLAWVRSKAHGPLQ